MRAPRPRDPWIIAAIVCLFGGAVLLVVAWYDISGTANVYEQLPYLVSAGFSGLGLIIVGSALVSAGRADRVERRLAQLIAAITEAADPADPPDPPDPTEAPEAPEAPEAASIADADADAESGALRSLTDGTTFHRPNCLLLRTKSAEPVSNDQIAERHLTPCPVCEPGAS